MGIYPQKLWTTLLAIRRIAGLTMAVKDRSASTTQDGGSSIDILLDRGVDRVRASDAMDAEQAEALRALEDTFQVYEAEGPPPQWIVIGEPEAPKGLVHERALGVISTRSDMNRTPDLGETARRRFSAELAESVGRKVLRCPGLLVIPASTKLELNAAYEFAVQHLQKLPLEKVAVIIPRGHVVNQEPSMLLDLARKGIVFVASAVDDVRQGARAYAEAYEKAQRESSENLRRFMSSESGS